MSLFTYEIAAPTNVVEASASPEPDDVSVVYIRIEAKPTREITENEISEIWFEINVLSASDEKDDEKKREALTRNPGNITPVAKDFGRWTFSVPDDENRFIARPVVVTNENGTGTSGSGGNAGILVKEGETLVFYLYDVEVIDQEGVSQVKVTEVYPNNTQETLGDLVTMRIRKINPNLRIDYFRANKYVTTVAKADPVTLSWATTSAETVELWGPDGSNILKDLAESFHVTSNGKPPDSEFKDAEIKLPNPPKTTSTYTLIAKGNAQDIDSPVALQQLTITVTDQVKTNRLTGDQLVIDSDKGITMSSSQLEIHSNKAVTISSSLVATGNLRINGKTTLDGEIRLNKDKEAGNRARVRAIGSTSDAQLHFDLLDSSRGGGWKEDVLVLHGNGHVGVGSSEIDASNKLTVHGKMKVSDRLTLDGNIILNKDKEAGNRARVRATGDKVQGTTGGYTSDAKLHFDLLDSSDASGWTEDVLVLHGNGHVGVGSSEIDDSNKLTVSGNMKVNGQTAIRDGLVPEFDSKWRSFDLRYREYNVVEYQETVKGIDLKNFILDIKVLYNDDSNRIYDVTNQIQISYYQADTPNDEDVIVSLFWRDLNLTGLGARNFGYVNYIYQGDLRVLVWKVPCNNVVERGNGISFSHFMKKDRVQ